MSNVTTWADGYGRWHAELPDSHTIVRDAQYAIADELFERAHAGTSYGELFAYVSENMVELPSETPGRIHFAEYEV